MGISLRRFVIAVLGYLNFNLARVSQFGRFREPNTLHDGDDIAILMLRAMPLLNERPQLPEFSISEIKQMRGIKSMALPAVSAAQLLQQLKPQTAYRTHFLLCFEPSSEYIFTPWNPAIPKKTNLCHSLGSCGPLTTTAGPRSLPKMAKSRRLPPLGRNLLSSLSSTHENLCR